MVRNINSSSVVPATVAPWRRISTIQFFPSARASEAPSSGLATISVVSPKSSRLSQNGTLAPRVAPRWYTGLSSMPEMQNGRIDGAWWWHTAMTSGRAL